MLKIDKKQIVWMLLCSVSLESIASDVEPTTTTTTTTKAIARKGDVQAQTPVLDPAFLVEISKLSKEQLKVMIQRTEGRRKHTMSLPVTDFNQEWIGKYNDQIDALQAQLKVVEGEEAEKQAQARLEQSQAQSASARQQAAQKLEQDKAALIKAQKEEELQARLAAAAAAAATAQPVSVASLGGISTLSKKQLEAKILSSTDTDEIRLLTAQIAVIDDKEAEAKAQSAAARQQAVQKLEEDTDALIKAYEEAEARQKEQEDFSVSAKITTDDQALDYFVSDFSEVPKSKEILSKALQILNMSALSVFKMPAKEYSAYMKKIRSNSENQTVQGKAAIAIIDLSLNDKEAPEYKDDADLNVDDAFEKYGKILESWTPVVTIPATEPSSFLQAQMSIAKHLLDHGVSQVSFADLAQLSHGVQVTPGFMGSVQVCLWNLNKMPVRGNIENIIDVVRKARLATVS